MKITLTKISSLALACLLVAGTGQGQTALLGNLNNDLTPVQSSSQDTIVQVVAEAQGLTLVPPEQVPFCGTFWMVTSGSLGIAVPLPCPPLDPTLPVFQISDGIFLVDGTVGSPVVMATPRMRRLAMASNTGTTVEAALAAQADAIVNLITQIQTASANQPAQMLARSMAAGIPSPGDGFGDGSGNTNENFANNEVAYAFDTNQLWLEITNVSNGWSYLTLHNSTNQVYAIWGTTNLALPFASWNVETEVWPTDTNCQPFTVANYGSPYLFLRAEDWTSVDSDQDGVPDWWAWKYFGNVNLTDPNLDYSGNSLTFAQDYSNNITPTVFTYTGLEVPNNYVSSSQPAVQLDVAGTPYYIATLIDDNNFSNAVWNTYSGSIVTVNLGSVQGWHDVWIGLRGHADEASSAVWQWKRLKLDTTPPALFVTTPTNGTVAVPLIQLTGYSSEALARISYDLSNAAGTVTNQPVLIEGQFYDTNTAEFTTNYFQGYDVPLTNGLNVITLYATDLAGNMSTLTTNIQCTGNSNPPAAALLWPQDGMQISGGSITLQGQVDDPTATVSVAVADANGNTNVYSGLTGRDGIFWIENVPLNSATNTLALTVNNAAGGTTANFTLRQSSVGLTVNAVAAGDTTVNGSLDTGGYTVWVNGTQATDNGYGTWTAQITPIGISGGLVQVTAIPNTDNGGNGSGGGTGNGSGGSSGGGNGAPANPQSAQSINMQVTVEPPQGVFVSAYHANMRQNIWEIDYDPAFGSTNEIVYDVQDWQDGQGGKETEFHYVDEAPNVPEANVTVWPTNHWPQALPNGVETQTIWVNGMSSSNSTYTNHEGTAPQTQEHCDTLESWMDSYNFGTDTTRRTADTEMKLATGGPLGSKAMNLWCLTATARDEETGLPIPPEQISIGSFGNLDTNGNLYVVLPDNDPPTVTPDVPGVDNYTFTVGAQEYTLLAYANSKWLGDITLPNPIFCVGQQVTFSPGWIPAPPPGISEAEAQWTLPGNFVNTNSDTNCDAYYIEDALQLKRVQSRDKTLSTSCWYVTGLTNGSASLTMSLTFTNGRQVSLNRSGTFDVYRPHVAHFDFPAAGHGKPMVSATNGFLGLINHDMSFGHLMHSDFSGVAGYTQVIDGEISISSTGGTSPYLKSGVDSLDNVEFPDGTESINPNGEPVFHDAPYVGLGTGNLLYNNYNDKFINVNYNTYLLFKPDGSGNIFVPLQKVTWNVNAMAHYGTSWTVSGNPPVTDPTSADFTAFPRWTYVFSNWGN
jgi:hypothetical protein